VDKDRRQPAQAIDHDIRHEAGGADYQTVDIRRGRPGTRMVTRTLRCGEEQLRKGSKLIKRCIVLLAATSFHGIHDAMQILISVYAVAGCPARVIALL
jgi:hypothetical protein